MPISYISYLNFIEKVGDLIRVRSFLFQSDSKNGGNNNTMFEWKRRA
jgi:hypothetical protein